MYSKLNGILKIHVLIQYTKEKLPLKILILKVQI